MKDRRGSPARIENALTETWRAAITEMCADFGIPRDQWDAIPGFRGVAEALALYRRTDELRKKHGWPQERALLEAAGELGLEADTVSRRLREWLKAAYKDAA